MSEEGRENLREQLATAVRTRMAPRPRLTISEWADRYRYLSREASAEPGKWRTDRAPYLRGMMDALADPLIERVVMKCASQIGKTEVLLNAIGFYSDQDPAPILLIEPSLDVAKAMAKDRIANMVRDTPRLKGKFADVKSRSADNTTLHKVFPGGHLTIVGANSPAGLAARPIRIGLFDEVDRYPPSAGSEGDPVALGVKRTSTFWNRKIVLNSSPTLEGFSKIDAEYSESDQRQFVVRCYNCGQPQVLLWRNVHWDAGQPETAYMLCSSVDADGVEHGCGQRFEEADKTMLLESGEWIPQQPGRRVAGFHLSALYSPWARWGELAGEFLKAQVSPELLKTFTNTALAETWKDDAEQVQPEGLMARREEYGRVVPAFVGALTAAVDVQADRLEILVRGWGAGEESALVHREILRGDPSRPDVWKDCDRVLGQEFEGLKIACALVDSGYLTQQVYRYVAPREGRVFASKGHKDPGQPIVGALPKRRNKAGVKLVMIGTDTAKDLLFLRLKIKTPGPGCFHWPLGELADSAYFEQLTAEKAITKYSHGKAYRVYEKTATSRNEALDLEVLVYAALLLRGATFMKSLGQLAAKRSPAPPAPPLAPERPVAQQAVHQAVQRVVKRPPPKPFSSNW